MFPVLEMTAFTPSAVTVEFDKYMALVTTSVCYC